MRINTWLAIIAPITAAIIGLVAALITLSAAMIKHNPDARTPITVTRGLADRLRRPAIALIIGIMIFSPYAIGAFLLGILDPSPTPPTGLRLFWGIAFLSNAVAAQWYLATRRDIERLRETPDIDSVRKAPARRGGGRRPGRP